MTTGSIRAAWNRFFHEPVEASTLSVYRILFGFMLLAYAGLISSDLLVWYGEKGVLPLAESKALDGGWGFNLLHLFPNTDFVVHVFFGVFVLAALCVTLGCFTRVASVVSCLCLISLHHRNVMLLHSGDFFLRIVSIWMMFADSGRMYSIDRLIRLARGVEPGGAPVVSPWPMRMIQLQVALLYMDAFLWKVRGEPWLNGTAIYYSSRLVEFWRFPTPYVFEHLWTIKLMTWGTLVIEFALGFLLWVKDLRYWILMGGVVLHAGIDWTMNIPLFAPIMITSYLTWVDPQDTTRALAWIRSWVNARTRFGIAVPVFFDGQCSFCTRSVNVLRHLDVLRRFRFIDMHLPAAKAEFPDLDLDRGAMELLLRTRSGSWLGGFDAFREMARQFPMMWPMVPILYVPPVPALGRKAYERIAARRFCIMPNMARPPAEPRGH